MAEGESERCSEVVSVEFISYCDDVQRTQLMHNIIQNCDEVVVLC